ncbi:hypothetical protein Br6_05026 [Rhodococcus sp. Br-6]|nr:hypothetical protein Br6_05026 [Rhodococcus sp. Br-6]
MPEDNTWKTDLLAEFEMITTDDAARILDADQAAVQAAHERGDLLGYCKRDTGVWSWPAFQFDRTNGCIRPEVQHGNQVMLAAEDPWGVLAWWRTPNSFIRGDLSPIDLVKRDDLTAGEVEELITIQFFTHP